MSDMNITDIREVLRNLVDTKGITFSKVAKETGLSSGALSSFMNGKYAGDNERLTEVLNRWIKKQQAVAEFPAPPRFIETPTVTQIWRAFRYAHLTECIGVVCGNPRRR